MATYSPEDTVKQRDGGTVVEWSVSPNSSGTVVPSGFNEWRGCFLARLSEPARDGRANQELIEALEKLFGADAKIVSGQASSRKSVWIERKQDDVLQVLRQKVEG